MTKMTKQKGFTLIELLVVIAIIGILSSVVLASLNSARAKARDAKRISDIKQIQLALEMYYDEHDGVYPAAISNTELTDDGYLSVVPKDPGPAGGNYLYAGLGSTSCLSYHLGATLETSNTVLDSDKDANAGTACAGSVADWEGSDPIYDVTP